MCSSIWLRISRCASSACPARRRSSTAFLNSVGACGVRELPGVSSSSFPARRAARRERATDGLEAGPVQGWPLPPTRRARARRRVRVVRHGTGAGQREHRQMPPQRHPGCNRGPGRAGADGAGARPASPRHRWQPARRSAVRPARRGAARREHHFFSRREPPGAVCEWCGAPVGACRAAELERLCRQREQWRGVRRFRSATSSRSCSP